MREEKIFPLFFLFGCGDLAYQKKMIFKNKELLEWRLEQKRIVFKNEIKLVDLQQNQKRSVFKNDGKLSDAQPTKKEWFLKTRLNWLLTNAEKYVIIYKKDFFTEWE